MMRRASGDLDDAGAVAEWIRLQEVGEAGLHFFEGVAVGVEGGFGGGGKNSLR